jgi:hypothetical protein
MGKNWSPILTEISDVPIFAIRVAIILMMIN